MSVTMYIFTSKHFYRQALQLSAMACTVSYFLMTFLAIYVEVCCQNITINYWSSFVENGLGCAPWLSYHFCFRPNEMFTKSWYNLKAKFGLRSTASNTKYSYSVVSSSNQINWRVSNFKFFVYSSPGLPEPARGSGSTSPEHAVAVCKLQKMCSLSKCS